MSSIVFGVFILIALTFLLAAALDVKIPIDWIVGKDKGGR